MIITKKESTDRNGGRKTEWEVDFGVTGGLIFLWLFLIGLFIASVVSGVGFK